MFVSRERVYEEVTTIELCMLFQLKQFVFLKTTYQTLKAIKETKIE